MFSSGEMKERSKQSFSQISPQLPSPSTVSPNELLPPLMKHIPNNHHELENDPVWELVDQASTASPSPTFVQDTLRRARLEGQTTTPWWRKVLSPKPLMVSAAAACAAIAVLVSLDPDPVSESLTADSAVPTTEYVALEDALANELLVAAAEDPSLISDGELLTLLF